MKIHYAVQKKIGNVGVAVSVLSLIATASLSPVFAAGGSDRGGGDPKAIEFLNYAKFVCKWMSGDSQLKAYSNKCNASVSDIYDSLGDYNKKAKLEFVPDQLHDSTGVNKPAVTSDGQVQVNSKDWISMDVGARARLVAMEMQVLCSVDDRYRIADSFGGIWDLEHGDRDMMEIPAGTKLLAYSPVTLPARSNAIGFFDQTKVASSTFKEILTSDDVSSEVDVQTKETSVEHGHMFGLGKVLRYGQERDYTSPLFLFHDFSIQTTTGSYSSHPDSLTADDLPAYGLFILTPEIYETDADIETLTITGIDSSKAGDGYTQTLTAVTDSDSKSVIKIIAFSSVRNSIFSFKFFANALQRHFAIILPQPRTL